MCKVEKVLIGISIFLVLILSTGCSLKFTEKEVIDSKKFANIMDDNKYNVTDATDQYTSYEYISSVQVAALESKEFQIEFYILDSEINAKKMFESNKSDFEKDTSKKAITSYLNMKNYSSYSINDGDLYRYLCRVENTLLYIDTTKEHKDEVVDIIAKLGY